MKNVLLNLSALKDPARQAISDYVQKELYGKGFNNPLSSDDKRIRKTSETLYCGEQYGPKNSLWTDNFHKMTYNVKNETWRAFDHNQVQEFIEAAINLLKPKFTPITIKLNSEYEAIVSSSEITVGCQKFPFDVIDKLNEAVTKARRFKEIS